MEDLALSVADFPRAAWSGRRVLITGAGGFVGSWLADALSRQGATVTAILRDQVAGSNFDRLHLGARVDVVRGSITDSRLIERVLNEHEVDTCFHLAAQAIVTAANRSPVSTFSSNVQGTWTVLEACRVSKLVRAVIVASSDKAYGTQPELPYTEDMPLLGVNPYDASKACTEILVRSYSHTFDLPVVVARCANIYGGGDLNYSRLIPGTVRSVLNGERPIIRSDGTPVRDYLYVLGAVAAYLTLAEQIERAGVRSQPFNFGTSRPLSAIQLVHMILSLCDRTDLVPEIRGVAHSHEIDRQYLSSAKAAAVLGWSARVNLEEGLHHAINWYRDALRGADPASRCTPALRG
jgi:CDP-glucose 4,6-dehydratase